MGAHNLIGTLFLKELFKGLAVTGRHFFARTVDMMLFSLIAGALIGFAAYYCTSGASSCL